MRDCALCLPQGETVLWRDDRCRVITAQEPAYPGFCRVIWQAHASEMTDLNEGERAHLLHVVYAVEQGLRELLRPDKINLASLGNQVPHIHWHVIPRFRDDAHFPDPIWSTAKRTPVARVFDAILLKRYLLATLGAGYT